jgi:uncharacterized phage-associated protein
MSTKAISFDIEKGIEAVLFIADKLSEAGVEVEAHAIAKLLFWADKWHLERYGSQVTGDDYIAMPEGPVPSNIYEIMKSVRGDGFFDYPEDVMAIFREAFRIENRYIIRANRKPDLAKLSESEIEALLHSVAEYGSLGFEQRSAESHGSAWKSAKKPNGRISLEAIIEELPNKEEVLSYIKSR